VAAALLSRTRYRRQCRRNAHDRTDLGQEFDENFVLQSGMVLVLEPVVWKTAPAAIAAKRSVITEEGWIRLTDYPYDPMATEVLPDERTLRSAPATGAGADGGARSRCSGPGTASQRPLRDGRAAVVVAGTRPFGPSCVLVRETGAIHLLSTWDEGVPRTSRTRTSTASRGIR